MAFMVVGSKAWIELCIWIWQNNETKYMTVMTQRSRHSAFLIYLYKILDIILCKFLGLNKVNVIRLDHDYRYNRSVRFPRLNFVIIYLSD